MNIFDIPCDRKDAKLVIIPVPWEATTSYRGGTSKGPEIILEASAQVDLYDIETAMAYKNGYFMEPISKEIFKKNNHAKELAKEVIENYIQHQDEKLVTKQLAQVNQMSHELNEWVYEQTKKGLSENKIVAVLGGDHSTPQGCIKALSEKFQGNFGILHIDAHADLRDAYEGFTHSHASIFYNVMTSDFAPKKLVQVGIRDFCKEEFDMIKGSEGRIRTFFDHEIKAAQMNGTPFKEIAKKMIQELPENVYISFDIDGLTPTLCPHTGTPVPGGLLFEEALTIFSTLVESGKKIIGFDLNEVSPGEDVNNPSEWDGNVGARILFKLCGWTMISNGLSNFEGSK